MDDVSNRVALVTGGATGWPRDGAGIRRGRRGGHAGRC